MTPNPFRDVSRVRDLLADVEDILDRHKPNYDWPTVCAVDGCTWPCPDLSAVLGKFLA